MKDPDNPDAWMLIHLHNDNALRPIGTVWTPLQFLGILKTCYCRSTLEQDGATTPAAKSYGYWRPLIEPMESNGFQHDAGRQTRLA